MRTHVVGLKVVDFVLPPKSERSVYRTTQLKCALLGVPIVTKDIYIYLIFESILASAYRFPKAPTIASLAMAQHFEQSGVEQTEQRGVCS